MREHHWQINEDDDQNCNILHNIIGDRAHGANANVKVVRMDMDPRGWDFKAQYYKNVTDRIIIIIFASMFMARAPS